MPTAYSYVRFSDPSQRKGTSEARQTDGKAQVWADANGFTLDRTTIKRDRGRSALHGDHIKKCGLGKFIDMIENGTVERGSALLVEHLDRATRQDPDTGYLMISNILSRGVDLVTLMDGERYTADRLKKDIGMTLKLMLMLFQGHEESAKKSVRLTDVWERKRTAMRETGGRHSRRPCWLDKDGTVNVQVATIRKIFALATEGHGAGAICRRLNQDKFPPIKGKRWYQASIRQYLESRAVLGEYQPCKIVNGLRIPDGEPIAGYYPAIIAPDVFRAVQAGFATRAKANVRGIAYLSPNLFTGLLFSLYDRERYHFSSYKVKGYAYRKLVPYGRVDGSPGAMDISIDYDLFEQAFFKFVREVDLVSLFPVKGQDDKLTRLALLQRELIATDGRIASVEKEIETSETPKAFFKVLGKLSTTRTELKTTIEALRGQIDTSESRLFEDVRSCLDDPAKRSRIASHLRILIDRIDILPIATGRDRKGKTYLLYAEIRFSNGERRVFVQAPASFSFPIGSDPCHAPVLDNLRKGILRTMIAGASEPWRERLEAWVQTLPEDSPADTLNVSPERLQALATALGVDSLPPVRIIR